MPGRNRVPSFQLASGTTDERDGSYNLTTLGSIFYNTDTSNVEVYHEDPSNNLGWRDLVMNNKEQIDISGNFDISGNVDIRNNLSVRSDNFNQSQILLLAGAGGLNGTGGSQGTATSTTQHDPNNANYVPSNAFNGSLVNVWHNSAAVGAFGTENLDFEFPYAVHITKYKIWPRLAYNTSNNPNNAQGPSVWTLQGSNDGVNYVDIEQRALTDRPNTTARSISTSITDGTGNDQYIVANATNAYKHIRLKFTASQNGANHLSIGELAYYGYIDGTPPCHLTVAGNVGIGTTTPSEKLEVKGSGQDLIYIKKSTTFGGVGIKFTDQAPSAAQNGFLRYYHKDGESYGARNCFRFSTTEATETVVMGGALLIGVDGKDAGAIRAARKNLFIQSTHPSNTIGTGYGWWIGAQSATLTSIDNDLHFVVVRNGTSKDAGYIQDANNSHMNFTGQHRTFVKNIPTNQLKDKEGLIVVSGQNEFIKMSGGVAYGNDAITINESLPVVNFSNKAKDKRCFGVISMTEDPEKREEIHGNFSSNMRKEDGDTRVYINSVGEGAIWVADVNGSLESGDYITTSNVGAYGMKQDDDLLHNYTVAKILMDCDFNPVSQAKKIIKKEYKLIDYWILYNDVKIDKDEYDTLPDKQRKIDESTDESTYYRIDQTEVLTENPEKSTYVYEQRNELVNTLDEHGEFQWENDPSGATEKAYNIRYLDASGTETDDTNYVYKAAFVGCTYHCG